MLKNIQSYNLKFLDLNLHKKFYYFFYILLTNRTKKQLNKNKFLTEADDTAKKLQRNLCNF